MSKKSIKRFRVALRRKYENSMVYYLGYDEQTKRHVFLASMAEQNGLNLAMKECVKPDYRWRSE